MVISQSSDFSRSDLVGPDGTFCIFLTAVMNRAASMDQLAGKFPQPLEFPEVLKPLQDSPSLFCLTLVGRG